MPQRGGQWGLCVFVVSGRKYKSVFSSVVHEARAAYACTWALTTNTGRDKAQEAPALASGTAVLFHRVFATETRRSLYGGIAESF